MYLNTLICLEENVAGYGKNSAKPSGHITIMSPGVVKCYVQNLRQLPKEYTVYLISKNQNKAVRIGSINPECMNKQTTWKVDLNNLQGTGVKGKDIDSAAIVVEGNSIGNTDTILIGYVQGKYLITSMLESALPKQKAEKSKPCACGDHEKPEVEKPAKPEEGPCQVIMPKPEVEKPAKPEEGPCPVIMPKPEVEKPVKSEEGPCQVIMPKPEVEKPAKPEEGSCQVIMPKPEVEKPAKPEEGPCQVIMPKPEVEKPAKPEEGPCPVIMPKPEVEKPAKPEEGPCQVFILTPDEEKSAKPEGGPCKGFIPTSDGDDAVEIEILTDLQEMFNRTADKEMWANKVQDIISANVNPMNRQGQMQSQKGRKEQTNEKKMSEEEEYLSQIELVLKTIQDSIDTESKEKKTLEDKQSDYKRDIARVRDIFNDSTTIEPFAEKDKGIDWVRISMAELISMPQFSYEWCTNPVISRCYYKFGFLILGKDKQIEQYYVGIPDIYDVQRKFVLSIDKIESFRGRNNNKLEPGDYGYWIVRI